ncbi:hypothetical protein EVG20_g1764 [Dentipellis fragilis]|uniref:DUF7770 domain-containing protein n=1 Tax=Dentipellis fragilis TaxID=205917 RepID=A0A4Y9ZCV6_9AGAM|nr:hypothetical protein EVG20_g1764 [Dentipellis fragilis]
MDSIRDAVVAVAKNILESAITLASIDIFKLREVSVQFKMKQGYATVPGKGGLLEAIIFKSSSAEWSSFQNQKVHFSTLHISARQKQALISNNPGLVVRISLKDGMHSRHRDDVLDLIVVLKLHLYHFVPGNSGCLYWQRNLMNEFLKKGWVKQRELNSLDRKVSKFAHEMGQKLVPYPPMEGRFYEITEVSEASRSK